jgi:hypothetical protein
MNQEDLLIPKFGTEQRVRNERHKFSWFPKFTLEAGAFAIDPICSLRGRIFTMRISKLVFNFLVGQFSF